MAKMAMAQASSSQFQRSMATCIAARDLQRMRAPRARTCGDRCACNVRTVIYFIYLFIAKVVYCTRARHTRAWATGARPRPMCLCMGHGRTALGALPVPLGGWGVGRGACPCGCALWRVGCGRAHLRTSATPRATRHAAHGHGPAATAVYRIYYLVFFATSLQHACGMTGLRYIYLVG